MTSNPTAGSRALPATLTAWPPDAYEWWEEKAAIIEADRGCSRREAEDRAEALG